MESDNTRRRSKGSLADSSISIYRQKVEFEDEILEDLEAFGLTRVEARTYVTLLSFEGATIGMLARSMGLHVPQLYGILEKLERKGFVVEQPGRPRVYRAVEPRLVLNRILQDTLKRSKRIIKRLSEIKKRAYRLIVPPIWVIKGGRNIADTAKDIIERAEIDILLSTNHFLLNNLLKPLNKAKERGVQIFVSLFPLKISDNLVEKAVKIGRVRLSKRGDFILIADSSTCLYVQHALFSVLNIKGYALLTEEPSLIDLFMHNFINRWTSSQSINDELSLKEFPKTYTCHRLALMDIKRLLESGYKVRVEINGYDTKKGSKHKVVGIAKEIVMDPEEGIYNILVETKKGKSVRAGGIDAYLEDLAARTITILNIENVK
ncbi:MAG: hypothetical protein DRJ38_08420 [Thermoprotei archaeon]|nr:MAG: hypothetical protein DRJ38_08420 [Thermoprotei archaeon]